MDRGDQELSMDTWFVRIGLQVPELCAKTTNFEKALHEARMLPLWPTVDLEHVSERSQRPLKPSLEELGFGTALKNFAEQIFYRESCYELQDKEGCNRPTTWGKDFG
jgi:hypothetical protein